MDRFNGKQAIYFDKGDELIYKMKGDPDYIQDRILDLNYDQQLIYFEMGTVAIKDLQYIKLVSHQNLANYLGAFFGTFGVAVYGYGGIGALVGTPLSPFMAIAGGTALIVGGASYLFYKKKRYKVNGRRKIQVIDLRLDRAALPQPEQVGSGQAIALQPAAYDHPGAVCA